MAIKLMAAAKIGKKAVERKIRDRLFRGLGQVLVGWKGGCIFAL